MQPILLFIDETYLANSTGKIQTVIPARYRSIIRSLFLNAASSYDNWPRRERIQGRPASKGAIWNRTSRFSAFSPTCQPLLPINRRTFSNCS